MRKKASGISPDHSEFEDAMEDIIQLFIGKDEEDRKMMLKGKKNLMPMQQKYKRCDSLPWNH